MVLSMTSFARREENTVFGNLRWELRSVNHRYLDVSLRLPDELRLLEPKVRERMNSALGRGKVECALRFQPAADQSRDFSLDQDLLRRLAQACDDVAATCSNAAPVSPLELLRWPGVMEVEEADKEPLYAAAMVLLDGAVEDMLAHRGREGDKLKSMILQRCDTIDELVVVVQARLPELRQQLHDRLAARLGDLKDELEPGRLEQEIVIQAQKMDVDEELDRLVAHVQEVRHVLGRNEPVGRRLDFLMQELNREANTLGSKSTDTDVTRASVDLKVLIEQIREQVQNIE